MLFTKSHIEYKTNEEIRKIRQAAVIVADIHQALREAIRPGVTTQYLDDIALKVLKTHGARSNFFGYEGYPAQTCISVNETIVHGIPGNQVLQPGDLVSFDCGSVVDGWHGDACISVVIPGGDPAIMERRQRLSNITHDAMWHGIAAMATGKYVSDIGAAIEDFVESLPEFERPSIVEEFIGHGIGSAMHMEPEVFNYRASTKKVKLKPGMVLCIEPIFTAGSSQNYTLDDGWTVKTVDASDACHWEHEVAIHNKGIWVLSAPDGGVQELSKFGITPVSLT